MDDEKCKVCGGELQPADDPDDPCPVCAATRDAIAAIDAAALAEVTNCKIEKARQARETAKRRLGL